MEQEPLDKSIKDSIGDLKVEFNVAHWQQMEMLLNNLPVGDASAIDAHFDAQIKSKVDKVEVPDAKIAVWAGITAGLSQAAAADAQFDAVVNEKIGHVIGTETSGWEAVEQTLDAKDAADVQFDKEVYSRLQNLEPSYQSNNWYRLVAKMDAAFTLREKLYRYKLLEATLMILFLLNCYKYLPGTLVKEEVVKEAKQEQIIQKQEKVIPPATPIFEEKIIPTNKAKVKPTKRPIAAKGTPPSTTDNNSAEVLVNTNNEALANTTTSIVARNYAVLNQLATLRPRIEQRSGLSISVSEMNHHLTLHTETGNSLISTVPSLTPNFVETQYITPLGCKDCKYSKIPARLRFGLVTNLALNNAYRDGQILKVNALNQKGFGYGSGFSLGFKYGRWEIETGLAYAAKQYDPNIIDEPSVNIKRTHFQTMHLQTLHIPANLRYNYAVLGKGRWHLYAQTGAALNVILRAEYDLAEVPANSRSKGKDITSIRLSQIDYNNGLLAGDGFKSNRYLSISMGGGVERYISPSWSIFVQPDFHFHFSGNRIGPNQDRINTLSLSFGARKSF